MTDAAAKAVVAKLRHAKVSFAAKDISWHPAVPSWKSATVTPQRSERGSSGRRR
jgi:hypothetical protein